MSAERHPGMLRHSLSPCVRVFDADAGSLAAADPAKAALRILR